MAAYRGSIARRARSRWRHDHERFLHESIGALVLLSPLAFRLIDAIGSDAATRSRQGPSRALLHAVHTERRFAPISRFPEQPVDVALMVPEGTRVKECADFLRTAGSKIVQGVDLFEVYRGEGLADGTKSLNFTVRLGADDRTLSNKDEENYLGKVRERCSEIGAELRG